MEDWLAATLDLNGGGSVRFGPDERDHGRIPSRIEFDTQIPGGFGDGKLVVPRPKIVTAWDNQRFAPVRIYGPGNQTAYEGRVKAIPRVGANEIEIDLEGWVAHLDDDVFREVFVDPDLKAWREAASVRKLALVALGYRNWDASVEADTTTGLPALVLRFDLDGTKAICEPLYDAGTGLAIRTMYWDYTLQNAGGAADWDIFAVMRTDDTLATGESVGDYGGTTSGRAEYVTNSVGRRVWAIQFGFNIVTDSPQDRRMTIRKLVMYGDHGLTIRGDAPGGLYNPDMIAYALRKAAPLIGFTEGPDGSIEPASFINRNAVFTDVDNTARKTIEVLNAYGGDGLVPNDWGIYERGPDGRPEFFWKTPGTYEPTWRLQKAVNVVPSDEGPDNTLYNRAIVTYQDAARQEHTIFPEDDERLVITDPDHPVNAAGIPARTLQVAAGLTYPEGAIRIAQLKLDEENRDERRGALSVTGRVRTAEGAEHRPWRIRAGGDSGIEEDVDIPNTGILTTKYVHTENERKLDGAVGAVPHRLEVLLAQLRSASE